MKKIIISDQTLKILAEEREKPLLFREKTAIAEEIEKIGADCIELAPVVNFKEDRIICNTIAAAVTEMTVCIPAGDTDEDITAAWECIKKATKSRLQIALPVSTLKMEYTYHLKDRKMLDKATALISAAKKLCDDVEFSAIDATRADIEFVSEICKKAEESGATCITLCDETGTMLPDEFGAMTAKIKNCISVPLFVSPSDALDLATANAIAAIKAGADGIKCSCASKKTIATDKLAKVLKIKGEDIGFSANLDTLKIHTDIASMVNKIDKSDNKISSNTESSDNIILDSDSTAAELDDAAKKLGYELSGEDIGNVLKALKQVCERKSTVGKKELEALIASYAMQAPSLYHLESYAANCGNKTVSMANVILSRDGQELSGISTGDGPIDAAFRAIEQSIGYHYELDEFQLQAVTEGKEALGAALVKLRSNGKLYSGNGISTDIVGATIRAYINALNKIVYEENLN